MTDNFTDSELSNIFDDNELNNLLKHFDINQLLNNLELIQSSDIQLKKIIDLQNYYNLSKYPYNTINNIKYINFNFDIYNNYITKNLFEIKCDMFNTMCAINKVILNLNINDPKIYNILRFQLKTLNNYIICIDTIIINHYIHLISS